MGNTTSIEITARATYAAEIRDRWLASMAQAGMPSDIIDLFAKGCTVDGHLHGWDLTIVSSWGGIPISGIFYEVDRRRSERYQEANGYWYSRHPIVRSIRVGQ